MIGLVTLADGEPVAVQVLAGTMADPVTVPAHVTKLRTRFCLTEVGCVGDRGMVKTTGQAALAAGGSTSIAALTTPQVRQLLRAGVVRLEWCTPRVHAVAHGPIRLVLRRSEAVQRQEQRRRHDKLTKLHEVLTTRKAFGRPSPRAPPEAGRRSVSAWVKRPTLSGFVQVA